MRLSRIFLLSICFLFFTISNILAQANYVEPPKLVVGIMIDGLQQKHLDLLWSYFDPHGFKKIMSQGVSLRNVSYNVVSAGNASDIATVMTGSVPYYHGISGENYFNRTNDKVQKVIADDQQIGIGTKDMVSAHNLLASTVLDELNMSYPSKAKTFAVAINAEEAIMLGGHTAQSVAWIDDVYLKWVTTGYYKEGLSKWADDMNVNGGFKTLATQKWKPLFAINTYMSATRGNKKDGFEYNPIDIKPKSNSVSIIKNTPAANALVASLGLRLITEEQMGMDNVPDMLMLQFTVRTPDEKLFSLQSAEKEDMYLRLDKEIQFLLQEIDKKVGLDKSLVFMFANQTEVHSPTELGNNQIPAGYFNANRSMALVNSYLMALYGQERWITGYYGKNIFLNRRKIEEKKLNLNDFQQTVANFMLEFEGIQAAFPASHILNQGGNVGSELARLRNSTHKSSVGDVIITLLPGWLEVDDKLQPVGESNSILSYTPMFFYGWGLKSKQLLAPYQVTDIAPTLSRILNIPMPNACIGKPIVDLIEK